jgi:hypothetical protein
LCHPGIPDGARGNIHSAFRSRQLSLSRGWANIAVFFHTDGKTGLLPTSLPKEGIHEPEENSGFCRGRGLLVMVAPAERARAVSLSSPGIAAAVQDEARKLTTEVRWHHHYGSHHH